MSIHDIEYTDQKLLIKTVWIPWGLFLGIETLTIWLVVHETWLALGVLSGIIIPIVYFFVNKRKIKRHGRIHITQDQLVFSIVRHEKKIAINAIKEYQIIPHNGVTIWLKLRNGENFGLMANESFCKSFGLEQACIEIKETIQRHIKENPSQQSPVRRKSMYEKTWFIMGLSIITLVMLGCTVYAVVIGVPFYPLLIPVGIFIGIWVAVFNARKLRTS